MSPSLPKHFTPLQGAASGRVLVNSEPGTAYKAREFLRAAAVLQPKEVIVASHLMSPEAIREAMPRDAAYRLTVLQSHNPVRSILEAAKRRGGVDAITCAYEPALGTMADIGERLVAQGLLASGAEFYGTALLREIRNKWLFRQWMNHLPGVLHVPALLVQTSQLTVRELPALAAEHGMGDQLVLLPDEGSSSQGVRFVDLRGDVAGQLDRVHADLRALAENPDTHHPDLSHMIAVQFVAGDEFSIEGELHADGSADIFAIHWKPDIDHGRDSGDAQFLEKQFVTLPPASPEFAQLSAAVRTVFADAAERAGGRVARGTFHAEARLPFAGGDPYVIELNMRPGGGVVPSSTRHATGNDLYLAAICCAFGIEYPVVRDTYRQAGFTIHAPPDVGIFDGFRLAFPGEAESDVTDWPENTVAWFVSEALATLDRAVARDQFLIPFLEPARSPLRARVRDAFALGEAGGVNGEITDLEYWYRRGARIHDTDSAYIATNLAVARELAGDPYANLADLIIAQGFLQSVFRGTVRPA